MDSKVLSSIRHAEVGRLQTLLAEHRQPVLLLGAGASVTSGVPAAGETVNRAAKWAYCKSHGRSPMDPGVVDSDWIPWLEQQSWFKRGVGLPDQYPVAIDNLLGIGQDRREFFEQLISRGVKPGQGYRALARILDNGWVATVLTTNFDHCIDRAAVLEAVPPFLVKIRTASDWVQFKTSPANPQLIHIHGSVEHYSDKNLAEDVLKLDQETVEHIKPLLRDHPLIVVGYRGMEPSVMKDLLENQIDYANGFKNGVFWCDMKRSIGESLSPLVQSFADKIGSNFNRVPIDGFDQLLKTDLLDQLVARQTPLKQLGPVSAPSSLPLDMRPFQSGRFEDLDEQVLFQRLKQYADKHYEPYPERFNSDWVKERAVVKKLLHQTEGDPESSAPTLAAWVMFARTPNKRLAQAMVKLTIVGPESWLRGAFGDDADLIDTGEADVFLVEREIGGTLWNQLNTLEETIALLNSPFLLKDGKSRQVTPYHPLAIHEMIVNALVHRDYAVEAPIEIRISPTEIETVSPGGLIDEVALRTGAESIESLVRGGSRGVLKGYRNPVISSFFYGSNEMERRGSGLADMLQYTIDNNGDVHFYPMEQNSAFKVLIFARPEAVDEITRTAVADQSETVRFTTNLLEFVGLPEKIWHAGTSARSASGLRKSAGDLPVPPGYVQDGRFFSFYDLERITSDYVTPFDDGDIEELTIPELFEQGNGLNIMRRLLHELLNEHLRAIGLVVDEDRRRAHFPKTDEPERKITYQGRVKRATRTIVKARTRRDSDDLLYYEHKAFTYSLMAFGIDWGLFINPGYVFTRDGNRRYLGRDRINILSTKRAARDFNPSVMHDVTFWMACLSEEAEGVFALKPDTRNTLSDYAPTVLLNSAFPGIAYKSTAFGDGRTLEDELERRVLEADQELEDLAAIDDVDAAQDVPDDDSGDDGQ